MSHWCLFLLVNCLILKRTNNCRGANNDGDLFYRLYDLFSVIFQVYRWLTHWAISVLGFLCHRPEIPSGFNYYSVCLPVWLHLCFPCVWLFMHNVAPVGRGGGLSSLTCCCKGVFPVRALSGVRNCCCVGLKSPVMYRNTHRWERN